MARRRKDILFHIENEVQFESIKPLLEYLRDYTKVSFDIVVPDDTSEGTKHNKKVHDGGARVANRYGFKVVRSLDAAVLPDVIVRTEYKILMSAYMYRWHYEHVQAKYRIMFPYASYYLNKPQWTIGKFIERDYTADALLSHAVGTQPVTDIFTKTYVVPSLKLMDYKKSTKKNKKPVLFFAPTYNEINFAAKILRNIDDIKKKYKVVMRGHHRVVHVDDNKDISARLYDQADEVYDMDQYSLTEALSYADVVISDNSAVIFDAIYCDIPVALFSEDLNSLGYKQIKTIQSKLVSSGDILWTDDPAGISNMIDKTLSKSMQAKQEKMRETLFPYRHDLDAVAKWMDVLQVYLDDDLPEEYVQSKRYYIQHRLAVEDQLTLTRQHIKHLDEQLLRKDQVIQQEENPGVAVATRRLVKAIVQKVYIRPKQWCKYHLRLTYRKIKIKYFNAPIVIYQFIFTVPQKSMNFGDELTKDVIERIFHKKTEVHNHIDTRFDMLGVGSLIHFFNDIVDYKTYVWGSGLIDDKTKEMNPNFIFKAVRGKTTRAMLPKKYREIPVGDPGLLCNLMYTNKVEQTDKIGVIPHFRDEYSYYLNDIIKQYPEIFKIIPVGQPPEKVADEIKSCRLVLSSSLHGLIVADSFGVPNMHLVLSDNLLSPNHLRGGEYKFRDYFSGIGREYDNFNPREQDLLDVEQYERIINEYKPVRNLDQIQQRLIKTFPYK